MPTTTHPAHMQQLLEVAAQPEYHQAREISLWDWQLPTEKELEALTIQQLKSLHWVKVLYPAGGSDQLLVNSRHTTKPAIVKQVIEGLENIQRRLLSQAPKCDLLKFSEAQQVHFSEVFDLMEENQSKAVVWRMGLLCPDPKLPTKTECYLQVVGWSQDSPLSDWYLIERDGTYRRTDRLPVAPWVDLLGEGKIRHAQYWLHYYFKADRYTFNFRPILGHESEALYDTYGVELDYRLQGLSDKGYDSTEGYPKAQVSFSSRHYTPEEAAFFARAMHLMSRAAAWMPTFLADPITFIKDYF